MSGREAGTAGLAAGSLMRWSPALVLALVGLLAGGGPLFAQGAPRPAPSGWAFSQRLTFGGTFDDNVALAGRGSEIVSDYVTTVTPRGSLDFRGRRTMFGVDYGGSYRFHQNFSELNGLDQRAVVDFQRRLSVRTTLFARQNLTISPTTDELDLVGIGFRRLGSRLAQVRSGVETTLNRRTSITAAYVFQWVDFEEEERITPLFRGGVSHGANADVRRAVTRRLAVGGEYDLQHVIVGGGTSTFDIHRAAATLHYRPTRHLNVGGGAGYAWFAANRGETRRGAPAFQASLSHQLQRVWWDVGYRRSFMPSFGFGGTFQNQELRGSIGAELTRRLDWHGTLAVRENEPMTPGEVRLRSVRAGTSVSFLATRWMRVVGFYSRLYQDARRAGGQVDRSSIGFQVVSAHTLRLQ